MLFTFLLSLSAFLVAGSAAYFSVLGIATLFSGSYIQVMIMAGSLEFGKLIATSYLYRYWTATVWWLKLYLCVAVLILMGITSMGIFGFLSAAYQVNSNKFELLDSKTNLINEQKATIESQIDQYTSRIQMLNEIRAIQEQRVQDAGNYKTPREQAYAAIDKANTEIKQLTDNIQTLQNEKSKKNEEILQIDLETKQAKDIGTFKFIANTINKPLNTVVIAFICVLIAVFDPLAVALVLAFNVATTGKLTRKTAHKEQSIVKYDKKISTSQDAAPRVIGINSPHL